MGFKGNNVKNDIFSLKPEYCEISSGSHCFSNSELLEWFMFQNIGSSMTLKLPPSWFSDNFVGFALCAIIDKRQ